MPGNSTDSVYFVGRKGQVSVANSKQLFGFELPKVVTQERSEVSTALDVSCFVELGRNCRIHHTLLSYPGGKFFFSPQVQKNITKPHLIFPQCLSFLLPLVVLTRGHLAASVHPGSSHALSAEFQLFPLHASDTGKKASELSRAAISIRLQGKYFFFFKEINSMFGTKVPLPCTLFSGRYNQVHIKV